MEVLKKNYIYYFILLLYIILVFIVGYHHEPWGDEAQCWLIARDNSFLNIFFNNTKYEGHPFLWFFIERMFINTHIANSIELYRWKFVLPLFFSAIGVYFFLFKSKFPLIIKCLIPFTYYIFYQNGVITRSHSLSFPMLMIIAAFYHKRFEHPYIYTILLFLTANIAGYTYILTLVLFLFFIVDIIREKKEIKKYILNMLITGFLILYSAILMIIPEDNTFGLDFTEIPYRFYHIAEIYFPVDFDNKLQIILSFVLTLLFYLTLMKAYCKNVYQIIFFVLLNFPLFIFYVYIYQRPWHYGYAGIFLLFTCWLLTEMNDIKEIPFKKNILLYVFLTFILGYYIAGNISLSYYDLTDSYDGSKAAAEFIKKHNLLQYKITGVEFRSVALQPYFEKNIYNNYRGATHFYWHRSFEIQYNFLLNEYTPVVVLPLYESDDDFPKIKQKNYYKYYFKGYLTSINYKKRIFEDNSLYVLVDKAIVESNPDLSSEKYLQ